MGYKLSGYEVLGCLEIDPKIYQTYLLNHKPKYSYNEGIQTFKKRTDLPDELYEIDILDGSPPCSSFSTAGNREKDWGKKRKFKEGQENQVLDDLFFDWIELVGRLRPKVAIAENVKGLLTGNAKGYVKEIFKRLKSIGYRTQLFQLNSAFMGVPQSRTRVFFCCVRTDIDPGFKLALNFNEPIIPFSEIDEGKSEKDSIPGIREPYLWKKCPPGGKAIIERGIKVGHSSRVHPCQPVPTLTTKPNKNHHWKYPRRLTEGEIIRASTFPIDYHFNGNPPIYICGMSVPPFMVNRISKAIYDQWLKHIP